MRNLINWTARTLLIAGLVAFAGCSKSAQTTNQEGIDINGVKVNLPKLQTAIGSLNNPDVQNNMANVTFGIRYGDYMKSMMALDKIANDPSLNDAQKKVANEVLEQLKQVVSKGSPKS